MPDHRALVLALVEHVEHGGIGGDVGGDRQRLVEGDVALAVDHHHAVEIHLAGPGAPGRDGRKRRDHFQRTRRRDGLIDESQFLLVHGVRAHADAIGVQHHLAIAVGVFLAEIFQRHQLVVLDRHRDVSPDFLSCRRPLLRPLPLWERATPAPATNSTWVRGWLSSQICG